MCDCDASAAPWYWISDGGYSADSNQGDRMPIHHKTLEKRRIPRKTRVRHEGRALIKNRSLQFRACDESIENLHQVRPETPPYLRSEYDYDRSSSNEDSGDDDDEEDKRRRFPPRPLEICQKVYLAACARDNISPRKKLVHQLTQPTLAARGFLLAPEDIKALSLALTSNSTVTTLLDLSGNTIGAQGAECLVQMLEENTTISNLNLSKSSLGVYEVSLLTEMLSENRQIHTFEAAGNNLDDECAACFAEALTYNRKLKKLNLSSNSFHEKGGTILAKSIETNDSIGELDLSWNHIRLSGATAWGDTIKRNEDLRYLNLSWNGFCDEGALAIGKALEVNTTLTHLDLANNRIGYDGCVGLSGGLKVNKTMQTLNLSHNPVSTRGTLVLLTAITYNEASLLRSLVLEGIQVVREVEDMAEQIREARNEFQLTHSGYVMSPDVVMLKEIPPPERKCRSSKK